MFLVFSLIVQHNEKVLKKSKDLRNLFFKIVDLTSQVVTWGQKEGGIYFIPWNHDRWWQRTNKLEYVFSFWWTNQELKQQSVNVELLKPTTPNICILCCLFTQTATWRPTHPILTSSVKEILKAITNTVSLGPSLLVVKKIIHVGRFFQQETVFWGWLAGPSPK